MIFTTNKPLCEWGKVLHDEDLAAAILDRVLERGRFIHLDGPSGRTRHLNLEALPAKSERLRISGNSGSEFPEHTRRFPQPVFVSRLQALRIDPKYWQRLRRKASQGAIPNRATDSNYD